MSKIPKEILDVKSKSIDDLLIEWNELITELSNNEVALYEWKHVYNVRASAIEEETDFKSLYGKACQGGIKGLVCYYQGT